MNKLLIAAVLLAAAVPASAANWCAIRTSELMLNSKDANQRMIIFILVENKGKTPMDATKLQSVLSVNGKPYPNWPAVVASGAEPAWRAIPAGGRLQFGVDITTQLKAPGAYTLRMGGDCPSNEARVVTL